MNTRIAPPLMLTVALAPALGPCLAATADDDAPYECRTFEAWIAEHPQTDPLAGACPTQGDCDVPGVRDAFLTNPDTPIRWLKIHLIVFRADDGSDPAATQQEIIDQMVVMNDDYLPHRIQFSYTWEYVNDSTYRYGSGNDTMKEMYAQDPVLQCNIFITDLGGGVGTFPWDPRALTVRGGIINGGDYFSIRHHVMSHEMGHNLGLWHTHHGVNEVPQCSACYERADGQDGDTTGDFSDDTPPRPIDFGRCDDSNATDPCSDTQWGYTQPENFMSYGSSNGINCWRLFTVKQAARMHCWGTDVLSSWLDCTAGDDCNDNGVSDYCDIRDGRSRDDNGNFIPDECEGGEPADLDRDGDVDFDDMLLLLAAWGPCDECPEDLNGDGTVGFADLLVLLGRWS